MKRIPVAGVFWWVGFLLAAIGGIAQTASVAISPPIKDRNTPRTFPEIKTRAQWEDRALDIQEQILVSLGLWPMPEKTPLNAHIFGKIERDGYSIEKVYFQTAPGFYLAGNLFRPLGKGDGPFPGMLCPHGHWSEGRLCDTSTNESVVARGISYARQGMIAFAYDMVDCNDTRFADTPPNPKLYDIHRKFATNRADQLWNISLMGVQTWNSIRALDFLTSLPDVDTNRIGCTGGSSGGTQTFMLGALDNRLAAQAPVCMVSHIMQGGCVCENAPALRVDYFNVEIAAVPAPRPQIIVGATGDWTRNTLEVEGPAMEKIYALFGATNQFRYQRFDFKHNYNQTSREAVYDWFGQWLLNSPDPASLKEQPHPREADSNLLVFVDGKLPPATMTKAQFIKSLKEQHIKQWKSLVPKDKSGFEKFKSVMLPAWKHTLLVELPEGGTKIEQTKRQEFDGCAATDFVFSRPLEERKVSVTCFVSTNASSQSFSKLVVLANADGGTSFCNETGAPVGLAKKLIERGNAVAVIKEFSTREPTNQFVNFFTTYNRTKAQDRVRDLMSVCAAVRMDGFFAAIGRPSASKPLNVVLCGVGHAGIWSLFAAPAADAVIADCNALDVSNDAALIEPDFFCPGVRNIGTFEGAAMLAVPHPLLLQNTGKNFKVGTIRKTYKTLGVKKNLGIEPKPLTEEALTKWISLLD